MGKTERRNKGILGHMGRESKKAGENKKSVQRGPRCLRSRGGVGGGYFQKRRVCQLAIFRMEKLDTSREALGVTN